jgi:predicted nucleic acid-binding protein
MWAAARTLYQPRWSDAIHDEWIRNLLINQPALEPQKLQQTRRLMDAIHPECLVHGYERHIAAIQLPDPDDRHVVAAAIHAKASTIVTFNLADFPDTTLEPLRIRAVPPDRFLVDLFLANGAGFIRTVNTHRTSLQKPSQSVAEYLESLVACGLPDISAVLESYSDQC